MRAHSARSIYFYFSFGSQLSFHFEAVSIFLIYKIEKSIKENKNPLLVCLFIISYHH